MCLMNPRAPSTCTQNSSCLAHNVLPAGSTQFRGWPRCVARLHNLHLEHQFQEYEAYQAETLSVLPVLELGCGIGCGLVYGWFSLAFWCHRVPPGRFVWWRFVAEQGLHKFWRNLISDHQHYFITVKSTILCFNFL